MKHHYLPLQVAGIAVLGSLVVPLVAAEKKTSPPTSAVVTVDKAIPDYKPVSGVSGNLNSIGSDTLNNLMTLWAEGFKKSYPNVNIQIEGKGSAHGAAGPDRRHGAAWAR